MGFVDKYQVLASGRPCHRTYYRLFEKCLLIRVIVSGYKINFSDVFPPGKNPYKYFELYLICIYRWCIFWGQLFMYAKKPEFLHFLGNQFHYMLWQKHTS